MSEVKQIKEHLVIIGLGSNISPAENLKSALYLLGQYAPIEAISGVWHTRAVGSKGPDFLNAAVLISTPLSYNELRKLAKEKGIELKTPSKQQLLEALEGL